MAAPAQEQALERALSRRDMSAFAVNRVIGAGIFGLPAVLFATVGPVSALTMVLAGLAIAIVTVCFAEVGSRYTETGGPYLYSLDAFGPAPGFLVGWLMWLAQFGGFAAVTNLLVGYLGWFVPGVSATVPRLVVITFVTASLTTINVMGIRRAATVNNALTAAKLVPLALFVLVGFFFFDPGLYSAPDAPAATWSTVTGSVFLALYAYSGFEALGVPTGEVKDPARTIPIALLTGLAIVAAVYVGVQVVSVGTLPDLGASSRPLADAAERMIGRGGAGFIALGALLSTLGVNHAILLGAGRMPFAAAERGQAPAWIAAVHPRFRTPHVGLILSAVGMWFFTVATTFTSALTISVGLRLLVYAITSAAVPTLRRRGRAPFHLPGGLLIPSASTLMCLGLLAARPLSETLQLVMMCAAGLTLWALLKRTPK